MSHSAETYSAGFAHQIGRYSDAVRTAIVTHGGDLVVMGGRCQKDYQHSVPKQKQPAGARLSLNFSTAIPAAPENPA
jgi:hypothetical protein